MAMAELQQKAAQARREPKQLMTPRTSSTKALSPVTNTQDKSSCESLTGGHESANPVTSFASPMRNEKINRTNSTKISPCRHKFARMTKTNAKPQQKNPKAELQQKTVQQVQRKTTQPTARAQQSIFPRTSQTKNCESPPTTKLNRASSTKPPPPPRPHRANKKLRKSTRRPRKPNQHQQKFAQARPETNKLKPRAQQKQFSYRC